MEIKKGIFYQASHEWAEFSDEKTAKIGISDHAQSELGDIVFVNLPSVGDSVTAGETFGDIESVKAVSDVYSPVTGVVTAINELLEGEPEAINKNAYDAWFIEVGEISEKAALLSPEEYEASIKEE